jgi:hypothetical protein
LSGIAISTILRLPTEGLVLIKVARGARIEWLRFAKFGEEDGNSVGWGQEKGGLIEAEEFHLDPLLAHLSAHGV